MVGKEHHKIFAGLIDKTRTPWSGYRSQDKRIAAVKSELKAATSRVHKTNPRLLKEAKKNSQRMQKMINRFSKRIGKANLAMDKILIWDAAHNAKSIDEFSQKMTELCKARE
jgi:folylpolyglutamate synthase/dihydropteroate synthase